MALDGGYAGKVAIVTGGSRGIGRAIVELFAAEGADVTFWYGGNDAAAGAVVEAQAAQGRIVHAMKVDVRDSAACRAAAELVADRGGRIDVLVNNAGVAHAAEFLDCAEEDFDRVLRVNLKSMFLCGQAVARHMAGRGGGGAIVNLSSVNAVMAISNQVPYVVSKGGINQLTRVMALSLAPHGIRVNAIGPGTIATELALRAVLGDEASRRRILSRTPLRRLGEPEEVAAVAAFLASDDASYMTGQTVYPDGGRMALNYTVDVD